MSSASGSRSSWSLWTGTCRSRRRSKRSRRRSSTANGSSPFSKPWSSPRSPSGSPKSAASRRPRSNRTLASSAPAAWPGGRGVALLEREAPAAGEIVAPPIPLPLLRRCSQRPFRRAPRPPISPAPARPRRARRSTAPLMRPCGRRRSLPPGSPGRRRKASWRWMRSSRPSTRCGASLSACRWR